MLRTTVTIIVLAAAVAGSAPAQDGAKKPGRAGKHLASTGDAGEWLDLATAAADSLRSRRSSRASSSRDRLDAQILCARVMAGHWDEVETLAARLKPLAVAAQYTRATVWLVRMGDVETARRAVAALEKVFKDHPELRKRSEALRAEARAWTNDLRIDDATFGLATTWKAQAAYLSDRNLRLIYWPRLWDSFVDASLHWDDIASVRRLVDMIPQSRTTKNNVYTVRALCALARWHRKKDDDAAAEACIAEAKEIAAKFLARFDRYTSGKRGTEEGDLPVVSVSPRALAQCHGDIARIEAELWDAGRAKETIETAERQVRKRLRRLAVSACLVAYEFGLARADIGDLAGAKKYLGLVCTLHKVMPKKQRSSWLETEIGYRLAIGEVALARKAIGGLRAAAFNKSHALTMRCRWMCRVAREYARRGSLKKAEALAVRLLKYRALKGASLRPADHWVTTRVWQVIAAERSKTEDEKALRNTCAAYENAVIRSQMFLGVAIEILTERARKR